MGECLFACGQRIDGKFVRINRMAGFGNTDLAVEIFINEADKEKAEPIIDDFKINL